MSNDRLERKIYRRSPGREYGYDYNPLHSRNQEGEAQEPGSGAETALTQRPDPRRTRQLLRQNILASKRLNEDYDEVDEAAESEEPVQERSYLPSEEHETPYSRRHPSARRSPIIHPGYISTSELEQAGDETEANVEEYDYMEPEPDYGQEEEARAGYREHLFRRPSGRPATTRSIAPPYEEDYEDEYYEDDFEEPAPRRKPRKKRQISRRGLLIGAGAAVVGTTAIAAYEVGPKIPGAVGQVGTNIEHQIQDAFNKGVAQGAEAARKELITSLENLEGVSIEAATAAARLTRVAYDVFVSPIVKFGAALTGNFLSGMAQAMKMARGWLAGAFQDNTSLQAIQKVLESWASQVSSMPKQLDAITDTDLDGAQAYLRALQAKLNDEKAKLQNTPTTPTPTSNQAQQQPQPKRQ